MAKKQTEWSRAYNEKAYDRLAITVPKGRKETVLELAKVSGYKSINGYINGLLRAAAGLSEEEWKEEQEEEWTFVLPADAIEMKKED